MGLRQALSRRKSWRLGRSSPNVKTNKRVPVHIFSHHRSPLTWDPAIAHFLTGLLAVALSTPIHPLTWFISGVGYQTLSQGLTGQSIMLMSSFEQDHGT